MQVAALEGEDPGDSGGAVGEGAWVGAEGVEGEVVDDGEDWDLRVLDVRWRPMCLASIRR